MRILVRAPNWLGDLVMSLPFLAAVRNLYPDGELMVLAKPEHRGLLGRLPFPVRVFPFSPGGPWKFLAQRNGELGNVDRYYTLPPSFSSALVGGLLGARERIGYAGEGRSWMLSRAPSRPSGLHRSEEYLGLLEGAPFNFPRLAVFPIVGAEPYYVLNVNSEAESRRVPFEQWARFLESFPPSRFILIGTAAEKVRTADWIAGASARHRYEDWAGRTTIEQLADCLAGARGLLSGDSGPAHLAAAVGIPVVVFFGAGDPRNTAPRGAPEPLVLRRPLPCSPCLANHCRFGTVECLRDLPMESMARRATDYLARS